MKHSLLVCSVQLQQKDSECSIVQITCSPEETALGCMWASDPVKPSSAALGTGSGVSGLPSIMAPWYLQQQQGVKFLASPHKPLASELLREGMNRILDHCPWPTFPFS